MLTPSDSRRALLPPDTGSMDFSSPRSSQQYGPTASDVPVSSSASLLGPSSPSQSQSRLSVPRSLSSGDNRASRMSYASYISRASTAGGDGWGWNDPEPDDYLHNPDPKKDRKRGSVFTVRGMANIGCLFLLLLCLIALFAGYPIITYYTESHQGTNGAFNVGGINATGQVPAIPNFPSLVDKDTPSDAMTWVSPDKVHYDLVFSDEFNKDGRTFFPGDDPFWQAVDIHYWATGDKEWYEPGAVKTEDGKLKITMTDRTDDPIHNLNYSSGMLQSWNQLCFQWSYYMEVSVSLPGTGLVSGFWPGIWTLGNLGRPGYGATTEGLWPYTYDSCDVGILNAQLNPPDYKTPPAALTGPWPDDNGGFKRLSGLPGQRMSKCTCSGDHAGPNRQTGRGAPEIDIIEAQVSVDKGVAWGEVSQSAQVAPFNADYWFNNKTTVIYDDSITRYNSYTGAAYQQAVSGITKVRPTTAYNGVGNDFSVYGVEVFADRSNRDNGFIQWFANSKKAWYMPASAIGEDPDTKIGKRLISEEPMAMILNFGISEGFGEVKYDQLTFPAFMLIDYVRVYQRPGVGYIGCDPPDHPTSKYINDHIDAYMNPNYTTWVDAGYSWPTHGFPNKC